MVLTDIYRYDEVGGSEVIEIGLQRAVSETEIASLLAWLVAKLGLEGVHQVTRF